MMELGSETLEKIERVISRYPRMRSALMPVLHFVQEDQGWISDEAIEWIADKLELQPINVLEVVTFFPYYRRAKLGRAHVRVCRTLSCALMGAYRVGDELSRRLKCPMNHTREDGAVTLEYAECLASCHTGPVALVGEDLVEKITPENLDAVVADIERRAGAGGSGEIRMAKSE